jgi:hypothetical protein
MMPLPLGNLPLFRMSPDFFCTTLHQVEQSAESAAEAALTALSSMGPPIP